MFSQFSTIEQLTRQVKRKKRITEIALANKMLIAILHYAATNPNSSENRLNGNSKPQNGSLFE